jgi:phospholipid/cholesterol/gamma-HCH transport system substrate-binding protein
MRAAIGKYLGDFVAIIALFVLAVGVGGYILSQQRLRFPLVEEKPFEVKIELPNAQAVQPGQGQTVRVAGVKVGDIGNVELKDGLAVVTLQIEPEYKKLIKKDASALLRTKTGLKDMFLEVDPGRGQPLEENETIQVQNSAEDIDQDEILSALDADTRDYLQLLISGAGKGLKGRGGDLRETFARLGPLHRDLERFSSAVARRRGNLKRLIHNYGLLTTELGNSDRDIVRLVGASNEALSGFAAADQSISESVRKLPGALEQTNRTLDKVGPYADELGPTLERLRPPFRRLDEANRAVRPLVREATPIIRKQIRPFTRATIPFTRKVGGGAKSLNRGLPDLATDFGEINRFFNIGAFNPGGSQGLTGDLNRDRARQEGLLYTLGWAAQETTSLFNTGDARGPQRRFSLGGLPCVGFALGPDPTNGLVPLPLLLKVLGDAGVCSSSLP